MINKRLLMGLLWIGVFFSPVVIAKSTIETISFSERVGATRVQINFNQIAPQHRLFALSNPDRLVIDFDNDTLLKPKLSTLFFKNPDIKLIRSGHPKPHTLRLVIEMKNRLKRYKLIPDISSNLLIIDLVTPSTLALNPPSQEKKNLPPTRKPIPELPKKKLETTLLKELNASVSNPHPRKKLVVIIDPGHGGKDPGAIGARGTKEKDVVLAIAERLAYLINTQSDIKAVLTRTGDYYVPLRERLKRARKGKGDLFIAIHADSYFNKQSHGVSVYALSQRGATSEAARWLARNDNDSELGGVNLSGLEDQSYLLRSVLIDLAQTATITDSLRLGNTLLDMLYPIAKLHYRRVEQAPFVVLKSPDIPSVLVETGFISNVNEEMRLRDKNYQNKLAQALFEGITRYSKQYWVLNR